MFNHFLMTFLFLFLAVDPSNNISAKTAPTAKVWGKIVQLKKPIGEHQYFITFTQDNKSYAYPLELDLKNKNLSKKFKNMIGKMSLIEGETLQKELNFDGQIKKLLVFKVKSVTPLQLKDLRPQEIMVVKKQTYKQNKRTPSRQQGGISIPDKVANTAIFIGGAVLLGNLIKTILKK